MKTDLKPRAELELGRFALDPYCKLYLPLSKLDGNSFMSKDAYGHLCTNHGSIWTPQGRSFDGVDDYVDCGTALGTLLGNNRTQLSTVLWFKTNVTGANDGILNIGNFSSQGEWSLIILSNTLQFRMDNAAFNQSYSFTDIVNWNQLVAVYDGSNGKAYLNGVEVISAPYTVGLDLSGLKTIIAGYYNSSFTLDGLIGEVLIYSRALTPQEILEHYIVGKEMFR